MPRMWIYRLLSSSLLLSTPAKGSERIQTQERIKESSRTSS